MTRDPVKMYGATVQVLHASHDSKGKGKGKDNSKDKCKSKESSDRTDSPIQCVPV